MGWRDQIHGRHGTKSVTVNLDDKTCDCRAWELTGIPYPNVVIAIHDSIHHPMTYVLHFYTREMYLKAYNFLLHVLRGQNIWDLTDKAPMLPPGMPKNLRGRPKKLRMREDWEGESGSRRKGVTVSVQGLQKMTSCKKMDCGNYRKAGHKKPKCPDPQFQNPTENEATTDGQVPNDTENEASKEGADQLKNDQVPVADQVPVRE